MKHWGRLALFMFYFSVFILESFFFNIFFFEIEIKKILKKNGSKHK